MSISKALAIVSVALVCAACASTPPLTPPDAYARFSTSGPQRHAIAQLSEFLRRHGVGHVVPMHELLQQGIDWARHRQPRYSVPDKSLWPNMVLTLKLLERFIIPSIGPVEVVSGFRTTSYNLAAGGARRSRHLDFSALDVIPKLDLNRNRLHSKLTRLWNTHGRKLNMGLGLYRGNRFHVDTGGYRRWHG